MLTVKKPHPVAICASCFAVTYRAEATDQRCARSPHGRRCRGVFKSAARDVDWKECVECGGTGKRAEAACPYCNALGWHFVRVGGL
jgi:hypothetical protein